MSERLAVVAGAEKKAAAATSAEGSEGAGRLEGKVCVIPSLTHTTNKIDVVVDGGMKVW
jgi:hypothetical protein